jgi:hypothetical protein
MTTAFNIPQAPNSSNVELGPFCQSCAMPLRRPEDFGRTAEGQRQNDYCHFCFAHGKLTEPQITFDEMLEKTITLGAAATGQSVEVMRAAVTPLLPKLKRWRAASA